MNDVLSLFHSSGPVTGNVLPGDLTSRYLTEPPKKVVALLGGGMDGFLALHSALKRWPTITDVTVLFFLYEQVSIEAEYLAIERQMKELHHIFLSANRDIFFECKNLRDPLAEFIKSPLTKPYYTKVAHGELDPDIDDDDVDLANLPIYIPNRNARFLVQALGFCDAQKYDMITFGAVGNVNLDNSVAFIRAAQKMHEVSGERRVGIYAPFALFSKSMVIEYAAAAEMLPGLGYNTVSCFFPKVVSDAQLTIIHCGKCRSCLTAKQGFKFAGYEHNFKMRGDNV